MIVGAFRRPRRPKTPGDIASGFVKARAGSWHEAQAIVPSRDRRVSLNSCRPSAIFSGVIGLSFWNRHGGSQAERNDQRRGEQELHARIKWSHDELTK
jgi:hypothetical protein